jgi:hypothetical protein
LARAPLKDITNTDSHIYCNAVELPPIGVDAQATVPIYGAAAPTKPRGQAIKMTKPKDCSLNLDGDPDLLKELMIQFKIECLDNFTYYQTPKEEWTSHAFHWMSGRLRRMYTQSYERKGHHLTWEELLELLEELTQNIEQPQFGLRQKMVKFKLEEVCFKGPHEHKSLAYGIGQLEELLIKLQKTDDESRCFALWNALPERMQELIRHDPLTQQEFKDYRRLKRECMLHQPVFDRYMMSLKGNKRPREVITVDAIRTEPLTPPSRQSTPPAIVQRTAIRAKGYTINPNKVPAADRYANYKPGHVTYLKRPYEEVTELLKAGKCKYCAQSGHGFKQCPNTTEEFRKGNLFFCPSKYAEPK